FSETTSRTKCQPERRPRYAREAKDLLSGAKGCYNSLLMRVGIRYDSHPFAPGRKLILGGVEIPHTKGLAGHSDADAVAHAVTDAILGAAGLGDIGRMFPNDDPQWKGASSIDLLNKAFLKVVEAGFQFVHADVTVIVEKPKLAPHLDAMEEKLAEALLTGPAHVSVKAKTNEGMGWIGR